MILMAILALILMVALCNCGSANCIESIDEFGEDSVLDKDFD